MYHRTAIYAAGEDLLLEVEVEPEEARVWIHFGSALTLWLDYEQAGKLADQLIAQLPAEGETVSEDQLPLS